MKTYSQILNEMPMVGNRWVNDDHPSVNLDYTMVKKPHYQGDHPHQNGMKKEAFDVFHKDTHIGEIHSYDAYDDKKKPGSRIVYSRKNVRHFSSSLNSGHHSECYDFGPGGRIKAGQDTSMSNRDKTAALSSIIRRHKRHLAKQSSIIEAKKEYTHDDVFPKDYPEPKKKRRRQCTYCGSRSAKFTCEMCNKGQTEPEKLKEEILVEGWRKHSNDEYTADASDLEHHVKTQGYARCPKCRSQLTQLHTFKKHYDRENDLTHSEGRCYNPDCGAKLTIFNEEFLEEAKSESLHSHMKAFGFKGGSAEVTPNRIRHWYTHETSGVGESHVKAVHSHLKKVDSSAKVRPADSLDSVSFRGTFKNRDYRLEHQGHNRWFLEQSRTKKGKSDMKQGIDESFKHGDRVRIKGNTPESCSRGGCVGTIKGVWNYDKDKPTEYHVEEDGHIKTIAKYQAHELEKLKESGEPVSKLKTLQEFKQGLITEAQDPINESVLPETHDLHKLLTSHGYKDHTTHGKNTMYTHESGSGLIIGREDDGKVNATLIHRSGSHATIKGYKNIKDHVEAVVSDHARRKKENIIDEAFLHQNGTDSVDDYEDAGTFTKDVANDHAKRLGGKAQMNSDGEWVVKHRKAEPMEEAINSDNCSPSELAHWARCTKENCSVCKGIEKKLNEAKNESNNSQICQNEITVHGPDGSKKQICGGKKDSDAKQCDFCEDAPDGSPLGEEIINESTVSFGELKKHGYKYITMGIDPEGNAADIFKHKDGSSLRVFTNQGWAKKDKQGNTTHEGKTHQELYHHLRTGGTMTEESIHEWMGNCDLCAGRGFIRKFGQKMKCQKCQGSGHLDEEIELITESVKKVREALHSVGVYSDSVGKNKDGHIVVRRGFFYRGGQSHKDHEARISNALTAAGLKHTIVDSGEHNAPSFNGKAKVANSNHFWTKIKLDEQVGDDPVLEEGKKPSKKNVCKACKGKAWIKDPDGYSDETGKIVRTPCESCNPKGTIKESVETITESELPSNLHPKLEKMHNELTSKGYKHSGSGKNAKDIEHPLNYRHQYDHEDGSRIILKADPHKPGFSKDTVGQWQHTKGTAYKSGAGDKALLKHLNSIHGVKESTEGCEMCSGKMTYSHTINHENGTKDVCDNCYEKLSEEKLEESKIPRVPCKECDGKGDIAHSLGPKHPRKRCFECHGVGTQLANKTNNEGRGYHGEVYLKHDSLPMEEKQKKSAEEYAKTHAHVMKLTGEHDHVAVRNFLDSKSGRHLHGKENDHAYVKKQYTGWKKSYNPEDYE